jgi:hypothetical protein
MRLRICFRWLEPREEGVFITATVLYYLVGLLVDLVFGLFLIVDDRIRPLLASCFWLNAPHLRLFTLYFLGLIIVISLHRL